MKIKTTIMHEHEAISIVFQKKFRKAIYFLFILARESECNSKKKGKMIDCFKISPIINWSSTQPKLYESCYQWEIFVLIELINEIKIRKHYQDSSQS